MSSRYPAYYDDGFVDLMLGVGWCMVLVGGGGVHRIGLCGGGEEKYYTWKILIWRENRRTDVPHVVFVLAGNHQYRPSAGKQ